MNKNTEKALKAIKRQIDSLQPKEINFCDSNLYQELGIKCFVIYADFSDSELPDASQLIFLHDFIEKYLPEFAGYQGVWLILKDSTQVGDGMFDLSNNAGFVGTLINNRKALILCRPSFTIKFDLSLVDPNDLRQYLRSINYTPKKLPIDPIYYQ